MDQVKYFRNIKKEGVRLLSLSGPEASYYLKFIASHTVYFLYIVSNLVF